MQHDHITEIADALSTQHGLDSNGHPPCVHTLVVEDDETYAHWLMAFLRKQSLKQPLTFNFTHVSTLADAIVESSTMAYQLVLLDLSLPDSDGLDTLVRLKTHFPNSVIICLTGQDDPLMEIEALGKGAQTYILKGHENSQPLISTLRQSIERHQAIKQQQESEKALVAREGLMSLGLLSRGIAHEFNNLNTIIRIAAQMLKHKADENNEVLLLVEKIIDACDRATDITSNMNAIDGSIQHLEPEPFNHIFEQTIALYSKQLQDHSIHVAVHNRVPNNIELVGAKIIGQILINLLVNADHALHKCENKSLQIVAEHKSNQIQFQVTDNGSGIEKKHLDKIFSPFFTTKSAFSTDSNNEIKGTGLGLSIVKSLVTSLNGNIQVESTHGVGTTFTVTIPSA